MHARCDGMSMDISYDVLQIMMQNITKECIQKTDLDMTEDSLLLNTSGNNNTDMMVLDTSGNNNTDALATPESATAESATPQSASRKTEIDDRGMTDSHTASAGELLAPQSATVGTEAMESKQSVSSTLATPSSTECVVTISIGPSCSVM